MKQGLEKNRRNGVSEMYLPFGREVRDISQGQKQRAKILRYKRACVTVKSCI